MTTIITTVNGEAFPIIWESVTAGQQIRASIRAGGGVSVADVVAVGSFTPGDLREVMAMVSVSLDQQGFPADVEWIADRVSLGQAIGLSFGDEPADDVPADLTPGEAAAVRAHRSAQIARESAAGVIEAP